MEWNISNITSIIDFINSELSSGKPMVTIEREAFGVNERVIHKRLLRLGYKKVNNVYTKDFESEITKNITSNIKALEGFKTESNITSSLLPIQTENHSKGQIEGIKDIDKLNLLIENIDKILKLIPSEITSNITDIRSGRNDVKSFRIDTGIYEAIKQKALTQNINISELINRSLEDYLKNYI